MDVYTVKDRGRPIDFEGSLLGSGSSYSQGKPRWFEVSIYKTAGGKYVVAGIGRSRVVHAPSCSRLSSAKSKSTKPATSTNVVPCDVCRPDVGIPDLVQESDREWAQVSEEPEAVIERLRLKDGDGVWYVPSTSNRALEEAAQLDEGIERALFAPQHID